MKITEINEWYMKYVTEMTSGSYRKFKIPEMFYPNGSKVPREVVCFRLRNGVFRFNKHNNRNISVKINGDEAELFDNRKKTIEFNENLMNAINRMIDACENLKAVVGEMQSKEQKSDDIVYEPGMEPII